MIVGPEEKVFYVHEKPLRSESPFFEAALNNCWKEGKEWTVALPEDAPDVFGCYLHWLYASEIACTDAEPGFLMLAKLYVFAQKALNTTLQDQVLDAMVVASRKSKSFPCEAPVNKLYEFTEEGSPVRRLMVDMYLTYGSSAWIEKGDGKPKFTTEFLVDLTKALFEDRVMLSETATKKRAELASGIPCSYHRHGRDEPCPAKKQ